MAGIQEALQNVAGGQGGQDPRAALMAALAAKRGGAPMPGGKPRPSAKGKPAPKGGKGANAAKAAAMKAALAAKAKGRR